MATSALLGQRIDMLNRIEGFRLTVFGLVLIGVGAAVIWRAVAAAPGPGHRLRRDPGVERTHRRLEVGPSPGRDPANVSIRSGRPPDSLAVVSRFQLNWELGLDSGLEVARAALDSSA